MQLLTAKETAYLKMTGSAMIEATEILLDWSEIALGSSINLGIQVHRALTSDRAISGYKAVYSILMIILLCLQYSAIWIYQAVIEKVDSKPPIIGELVEKPESIPDPWQTEPTLSLIPGRAETAISELSPIAGFLPPATSPKTRAKKESATTATKTPRKTRKPKNEVVTA